MAKRLYEIATELGMRAERLLALVQRQGIAVGSLFEEIDSETERIIRRRAKAEQPLWSRMKTVLHLRPSEELLRSAAGLSEEEEFELEDLVARHEAQSRGTAPPFDFTEGRVEGEPRSRFGPEEGRQTGAEMIQKEESPEALGEESLAPWVSESRPIEEVSEGTSGAPPAADWVLEDLRWEVSESRPEQELSEEMSAEIDELDSETEELLGTNAEFEVLQEADQDSVEEMLEDSDVLEAQAPDLSAAEEIPFAAPQPVAEAESQSVGDSLASLPTEVGEQDSAEAKSLAQDLTKLSEELKTLELEPALPTQVEEGLEATVEGTELVSGSEHRGVSQGEEVEGEAESLTEQPAFSSVEVIEEKVEGEPLPEAAVGQPVEIESAAKGSEDFSSPGVETPEPLLSVGVETAPELQTQAELKVEGVEQGLQAMVSSMPEESAEEEPGRAGGTVVSEVEEPISQGAEVLQPESPAPEEPDQITIDQLLGESPEPPEAESPQVPLQKALEAESLLSLDQALATPQESPKGLGAEELLGLRKEGETQPTPGTLPRSLPALVRLPARVLAELSAMVLHPGQFFKSLSNLELVFVCLVALLAFSGLFYVSYRWYNFYRPGLDKRFFERAELLRQAECYSDACEMYHLVLDYHPNSPFVASAYFGLAESLCEQGQFREAALAYEKSLAVQKLRQKNGEKGESTDSLVESEVQFRLTRALLQAGFYEKAEELLERLAQQHSGQTIGEDSRLILADLYARWAKEENQPERYRKALAEYAQALVEYPTSPRRVEVLTRLGDTYRSLYTLQPEGKKDKQLVQEAIVQFENAIRQAEAENAPVEQRARLRVAWADAQGELGAHRVAIAAYDQLLGSDLPMDLRVEVLEKVARSWLALEDYSQAAHRAQELIAHNPDEHGLALAYYILGDAEWERPNRDFAKMMQYYQKALGLDDHSGPDGSHSERAYMRLTNVLYLVEHNYEQAAEKYRIIIEKYPQGPYTYRAKFLLAECLDRQGLHLEAADAYKRCIEDFERGVYVSPTLYRDALYRHGNSLFAGQHWAEAVRAYQSALKALGFPDTEEAIVARERLADSYAALGDYAQAERILENLRDAYPKTDRDGHISLKLAQTRLGMFDYRGAQKTYLELVRQHREPAVVQSAYIRLASSYVAQLGGAKPEEAEALRLAAVSTYEAAQKRFPEAYPVSLELGKLYRDLGDNERSEQHLRRFLRSATAQDAQVEATVLLAEIALEEGRADEAVNQFRFVDQLPVAEGDTPWRARACYRLAESLREQGLMTEAKAQYERLVSDFPGSEWEKEADWKLKTVDWQIKVSQAN